MFEFQTSKGVGVVVGDQKAAREIYMAAANVQHGAVQIDGLDPRDIEHRGEPVEKLVKLLGDSDYLIKIIVTFQTPLKG